MFIARIILSIGCNPALVRNFKSSHRCSYPPANSVRVSGSNPKFQFVFIRVHPRPSASIRGSKPAFTRNQPQF